MLLFELVKLMRPVNCAIASIGVLVGFIVSTNNFQTLTPSFFLHSQALTAMVSVFFVCGAGQAINDFFDQKTDAKKTQKKPIPSGKIQPMQAFWFSMVLFLIGILLAFFVNILAFLLAVLASILLFVYSWKLKTAKFLGNILVALATALTLIFGATINNEYFFASFFASSAFFANLGRELTKDIEDQFSDKDQKKTLAHFFPKKTITTIVLFAYTLAGSIALSLWFSKKIQNSIFLLFMTASIALFATAWFFLFNDNPQKSQTISKTAMIISLIGFVSWMIL